MKKRLISLILAAIVLLSCAFAEESQSEEYLLPYIDLYAVPLGDNAIFEIPNEWGYQTSDAADVPPMTSLLTDQNQMVMAMKLPPTGRRPTRATRWASSRSLLRERR